MALIGPMMRKFNENSDDYFRGGARGKWWLLGPSLSLSMTSATVYTGVTGAIYEAGLAPLASNVGQWVAGAILVIFLAAWFRRLRFVTAAEAIRQRFGPVTEQLYAYLHMLTSPMYGALQLLGLSMFTSVVFQIPLDLVIIGLGGVVAFYSTSGGRWAVMATDFIQALVLLPVVAAVCILAVNAMGGVPSLLQQVNELDVYQLSYADGAFPDGSYTMPWILAMFFVQFIMQLNIGFNARFFSAKDGVEARKAALLMTLMMIGGTICYTLPALASRVLYSDQVAAFEGILNKPAEASFVVTCLNLMPTGLMGMVLVAMFSATASSMDTGLNTNAGIIVRNILPPIRRWMKRPHLTPYSETAWGKGTTLILSIITIGLTLWIANRGRGGIFEFIINFGAAVNLPMGLPFFLVLLFPTAPRISAILSILTGLVLPWLLIPMLSTFDISPDYDERVGIITACTLLGFFGSYLLPSRESVQAKADTAAFHANLRRPVDFEAEVGGQNDAEQYLVLGRMSLILSAGIVSLIIIPNPIHARGVIFMIASVSGIIGILFSIMGRCLQRRSRAGDRT